MTALYNEIEPYAAAWLRNLSDAGHIAHGAVDTRSVRDLDPTELVGLVQFHTFAGIGAWSYALRLAGWPDDRPVWTGSCPCQPFSQAGKGGGFDDERHLWPDWFRLIRECRPDVVFGEQVASPDGYHWLDLVRSDLEGAGYAVGVAVLPAAGVGAPHGRHRIFFVADADTAGLGLERVDASGDADAPHDADGRRAPVLLADAASPRREGLGPVGAARPGDEGATAERGGAAGGVGDAEGERRERGAGEGRQARGGAEHGGDRVAIAGPWADCAWLPCRDGKARPTQPGLLPLAHGHAGRMARLRPGFDGSADYPIAPVLKCAGNAIVPHVAAAFIRAFLDVKAADPTALREST